MPAELRLRAGVIAVALVLAGCVPPGELGPHHQPSGASTPLPAADFAAYVGAAKAHIRTAGELSGEPPASAVVEDRAPFELRPDPAACPADAGRRRGALLIHGLGDSPYTMRALGERLRDACFLVRAILLPGHGTMPGDLLEADRAAWALATRRGLESFTGAVDEVILVGGGVGGALAIDQVLDDGGAAPVAGLALIAPALRLRTGPGSIAGFGRLYDDALPEARWVAIYPDEDPVRYDSLTRNAALEADRLGRDLERGDGPLDLPVFMVLSAADATIDSDAALDWFCDGLAGPRRLIWYGPPPERAADCAFVTVRRGAFGDDIIAMSHVALPVAPGDRRYGETGAYLSCLHYFHDPSTPNYLFCIDRTLAPPERGLRFGEIGEPDDGVVVRRLTWNPDFLQMADDLVAFFGR